MYLLYRFKCVEANAYVTVRAILGVNFLLLLGSNTCSQTWEKVPSLIEPFKWPHGGF